LDKTAEELAYFEGQLDNLSKCTDEIEIVEIREELEKLGYVRANHNRRAKKALQPSAAMKFVSRSGTEIFVGKNNVQNDKLTGAARATDTWLHTKDIPGSHVIIASANPDAQTLEDAATLAAYFSKARASSNVPVDITLKKYVKKPGGARPGFVIYTNQSTVFVTPGEEAVKRLSRQTPPNDAPGVNPAKSESAHR
jgi:predicted ribosome quality control (RQC) complex YloA/Tae2 family protein